MAWARQGLFLAHIVLEFRKEENYFGPSDKYVHIVLYIIVVFFLRGTG